MTYFSQERYNQNKEASKGFPGREHQDTWVTSELVTEQLTLWTVCTKVVDIYGLCAQK